MNLDPGDAGVAARGHVIDAVGCGNPPLQGLGDEALHRAGTGARIGGLHHDEALVDVGELAQLQLASGLQPEHEQQAAGDEREYGPADEEIGEAHGFRAPRRR